MIDRKLITRIMNAHETSSIEPSPLSPVLLPNCRSIIVLNNNSMLYAFKIPGLEGLFDKGNGDTWQFGRTLCDQVKLHFACAGFFTSDELPRYNISESDVKIINREMKKQPGELLFLFGYDMVLSQHIRGYLIGVLRGLT